MVVLVVRCKENGVDLSYVGCRLDRASIDRSVYLQNGRPVWAAYDVSDLPPSMVQALIKEFGYERGYTGSVDAQVDAMYTRDIAKAKLIEVQAELEVLRLQLVEQIGEQAVADMLAKSLEDDVEYQRRKRERRYKPVKAAIQQVLVDSNHNCYVAVACRQILEKLGISLD